MNISKTPGLGGNVHICVSCTLACNLHLHSLSKIPHGDSYYLISAFAIQGRLDYRLTKRLPGRRAWAQRPTGPGSRPGSVTYRLCGLGQSVGFSGPYFLLFSVGLDDQVVGQALCLVRYTSPRLKSGSSDRQTQRVKTTFCAESPKAEESLSRPQRAVGRGSGSTQPPGRKEKAAQGLSPCPPSPCPPVPEAPPPHPELSCHRAAPRHRAQPPPHPHVGSPRCPAAGGQPASGWRVDTRQHTLRSLCRASVASLSCLFGFSVAPGAMRLPLCLSPGPHVEALPGPWSRLWVVGVQGVRAAQPRELRHNLCRVSHKPPTLSPHPPDGQRSHPWATTAQERRRLGRPEPVSMQRGRLPSLGVAVWVSKLAPKAACLT